jgi:hypothetical protein
MNVSTHVLVGGLVGFLFTPFVAVGPSLAIAAGMLGGLVPEMDFLFGKHRKTLHYPFGYFLAVLPVLMLSAAGYSGLALVAVGLLSAGVHSFMDIFAGAELKSWDTDEWQETAVYNHMKGEWIRPRRVAYGGSLQDNLISATTYIFLMLNIS